MVPGEDRLNLSSLYGARGLSYLLSLLMVPYLTRVLGPESFGILAYTQSFGNYLALGTELGLGLYGERLVARTRAHPQRLPSVVWTLTLARLGFALLGFGVTLGVLLALRPTHLDLLVIAALNSLIAQNFPSPIMIGLEKQRFPAIVGLSHQSSLFLYTLAFVREPGDLKNFLSVSLLLSFVIFLGGMIWLFRSFGKPSWRTSLLGQFLKGSLTIYTFQLTTGVYNSLGPLLLFHLKGAEAAALYAASEKLVKASLGLWGPFFALIPPKLSYWYEIAPRRALLLAQKYLRSALFIGGALSLGLFAFAPFAPLLFGSAYLGTSSLIILLSPVPLLVAISNVLGLGLVFARGRDSILLGATLTGASVFLGLGIPLMWGLGPHGASLALTLAEGATTLVLAKRALGGAT